MPRPEPRSEIGFEILRSAADGDGWALAARVPEDSPLVAGHFPGRPIVPGVALLALVARALHDWRGGEGEMLGLRGLKLRRPVGPGDTLALRLGAQAARGAADEPAPAEVAFELRRDDRAGEAVATGSARVGARPPGHRP